MWTNPDTLRRQHLSTARCLGQECRNIGSLPVPLLRTRDSSHHWPENGWSDNFNSKNDKSDRSHTQPQFFCRIERKIRNFCCMFPHHGSLALKLGTREPFGNILQDWNNIHEESTNNQELDRSLRIGSHGTSENLKLGSNWVVTLLLSIIVNNMNLIVSSQLVLRRPGLNLSIGNALWSHSHPRRATPSTPAILNKSPART